MRRFAALYSELDACSGTNAKVEVLAAYFAAVDPGEAIWALQVLLGRGRRRLISARRLREICLQGLDLPEWLFDDCQAQVGDSAEAIALLWPAHPIAVATDPDATDPDATDPDAADPVAAGQESGAGATAIADRAVRSERPGGSERVVAPDRAAQAPGALRPPTGPHAAGPALAQAQADGSAVMLAPALPSRQAGSLQHWMEQQLPAAAARRGQEQVEAVWRLWQDLDPSELLVVCKLFSGGLRLGVARGLVVRALARLSGLEEALLQHRLMGDWQPTVAVWEALLAPPLADRPVPSRPYPFLLASPLEAAAAPAEAAAGQLLPGPISAWLVEWKWDGIRGQLIRRAGQSFLWSRGEELIEACFPELLDAASTLPDGSVLDGEVIVWRPGAERPEPFASLQRRLGRRRVDRRILQECPAVFLAYDLIEMDGVDQRRQPLSRRRLALESLLRQCLPAPSEPGAGVLRQSPVLSLQQWQELEPLRQQAPLFGAEGLMLKALDGPYLSGRRRGLWWKHKRDPYRLDAVLLYAQAGRGRRADLFTDYTFALWDRPADPAAVAAGDAAGETGLPPSPDSPAARTAPEPASSIGRSDAPRRLVSFAKAYSGLDDGEIRQLDRWIRSHTIERYGPVRAVQPLQVFELAFEGLQRSGRHRSGIAVRFPRISRWRQDKTAAEADTLQTALSLLQASEQGQAPL